MESTSNDLSNSLLLDNKTVKKLLVDFIRDESCNVGFSKVTLGLSGGIDSSVVAFLAAEAFSPKNVTAVLMPYKTSSKESITHSKKVISKLGIKYEEIDISELVSPLLKKNKVESNLRAGNIMARMRMVVLFDISQRDKSLVIGTSNKTEYLLGYSTIFGDSACAINPIGDLYKTQLLSLAEYLGVPKEIISKKPTADLWPGQTDESEMGFNYKDVDKLLYAMIDDRRNTEELIEMGFKKPFITKVRNLVQKNQFKRKLPVIAKISNRTINVDFRYVRDWGN